MYTVVYCRSIIFFKMLDRESMKQDNIPLVLRAASQPTTSRYRHTIEVAPTFCINAPSFMPFQTLVFITDTMEGTYFSLAIKIIFS